MRTAQRTVDRLLAGRRSRKKLKEHDRTYDAVTSEHASSQHSSRNASLSRNEEASKRSREATSCEEEVVSRSEEPPELLDSNPNFRAEKSRRAWRAKRQADRGPKPHHRKHRNRKSGEAIDLDPILHASGASEMQPSHQTKFEMDSEDEQGNLDPDIILVKHKGSMYNSKFPAFSIAEGSLLVGHLRQQVARDFGVEDASRVTLLYKGKSLKTDSRTCHEEGLKMRSEILCVVKRTASEELEFLSNKFRAELQPQGVDFILNTPVDAEKREIEYRKISETILAQILLKADTVELEGDDDARMTRKMLVKEVQSFLNDLDVAAKKDAPSDWHADFLPQRRPSATPLDNHEPPREQENPGRIADDHESTGEV